MGGGVEIPPNPIRIRIGSKLIRKVEPLPDIMSVCMSSERELADFVDSEPA